MGCGCWNHQIQEEHRILDSQREALKNFLEQPTGPRDRRSHAAKILCSLGPCLRLHLRREEQVLFPAFEHLLGGPSGALALLRTQHDDLRALLDRLAQLLENREKDSWQTIVETGEALVALLEDHEQKEGRLMANILEYSLQPQQLMELAREFTAVSSRLAQEET